MQPLGSYAAGKGHRFCPQRHIMSPQLCQEFDQHFVSCDDLNRPQGLAQRLRPFVPVIFRVRERDPVEGVGEDLFHADFFGRP